MDIKKCPQCKQEKPFEQFYSNRSRPDGRSIYCRVCILEWYTTREAERRHEIRKLRITNNEPGRGTLAENGKKRCGRCGEEKEATSQFFGRNVKQPDALEPTCKLCRRQTRWDNRQKYIEYHRRYLEGHKDTVQAWRVKIRAEMVAAYGGACACCGETEPDFLTLDHIGGLTPENHPWNPKRRGSSIYGKLKKLGWPKLYRLLCWNCNCASRWTGV